MSALYERLHADAEPEWSAYVGHRFVRELGNGTLQRTEFIAWMVQDYFYLIHYVRAYALLVAKSDTLGRMRANAAILNALLHDEMSLHRAQLHAAGITDADLAQTAETLETLAYSRYLLDRAHTGDALDLTVALTACLAGYGEIGARLNADPANKIAEHPYRDWIEAYGGPGYTRLVQDGLAELEALGHDYGGTARYPHLLTQFRQSVRLETAFWNAGRTALATA